MSGEGAETDADIRPDKTASFLYIDHGLRLRPSKPSTEKLHPLSSAALLTQVIEGDGLPPYICQKCIAKLNVAFQFKTQCENSDSKLRQCFESMQQLSANQDLFVSMKKDPNEFTAADGNHVQDISEQLVEESVGVMHASEGIQNGSQIEGPSLQTLENVQLEPTPPLLDKNQLNDLKMELCDMKPAELDLKVEDLNLR